MSLFDALGTSKQGQAPQINPQELMPKLKSDPVGTLKSYGFNIPSGMNNPQQIVNHLLKSGQLPQSRYMQILQRFGIR